MHESCDYWCPPECQHYKTQSGCKFGEKCVFRDKRVDSQPNKKQKKNGGKGSLALWKNSKQFGCVFENVEPPKSIIYEGTKSLAPKRSVQVPKVTLRHVKIRERKGPSQGVIQNIGTRERAALMLRNLRIDVKKKP